MGKKSLCIYFLLLFVVNSTFAQRKKKTQQVRSPQQELFYHDKTYLSEIKSVEFYNTKEEQSLPLIRLSTNESIHLSFDDLRADIRRFYFSIEHCDIHWKKSNLSSLEYTSGYGEDQIINISRSLNTLQSYTHYQINFPTENTRPLLSGNYLLKVYEDADKRRLILTRRFYVLDEKVKMTVRQVASTEIKNRKSNQKIEVAVNTQALTINNPSSDVKVMVMQNNRPDVQLWDEKPSLIKDKELMYNHPNQFNFPGGQEFLYTDLRSFRLPSTMIRKIDIDSLTRLSLLADKYLDNSTYSEVIDENGRFYIRNLDQQGQSELLADYAELQFTLQADVEPTREIFLLGSFNNFNRDKESRMRYDQESKSWKINILLKQGVYDYLYATDNPPSFYETKNTYQIFAYYRNPRLNRDEIVGFHQIN